MRKHYSREDDRLDQAQDEARIINFMNSCEADKSHHVDVESGRVCLTKSEAEAISHEFGWPMKRIATFWRKAAREQRLVGHGG